MTNSGGRPTKLTDETRSIICNALVDGCSYDAAAAAASVSVRTFYRWLESGRKEDAPEHLAEFAADVEEAANRAEVHLVKKIQKQTDTDWRSAAWLLSRRYPGRWSERREIAVETSSRSDGHAEVMDMLRQLQTEDEK